MDSQNIELTGIDYSKVFELDPKLIKVHDELPRVRKDLGKIAELAESIKKFGQLQPVIINRNNELVAGGRRLAAVIIAGLKVKACYVDAVDVLTMREMELEENIQRKDLSPAEEVLALAEMHKLNRRNMENLRLDRPRRILKKKDGKLRTQPI